MIEFVMSGSFDRTETFLQKMSKGDFYRALDRFGRIGVDALRSATPIDSGLTSEAWGYEVRITRASASITWYNTNVVTGVPVAILLQYGHGTGTGGYVQGRDYINPALRPIFDNIAEEIWREVTNA